MSKIIRLPQDSRPTGCKWTPMSRLKTTCQGSPPPGECFSTSAEVSWVAKMGKEWWKSTLDTCFVSDWVGVMAVKSFSNTSCVFFPQLLVDFDTAVRSGSWSTSLPESPEAHANREGKSLTTNKCSLTHSRHSMSHCVSGSVCVRESVDVCLNVLFNYILFYFSLCTLPTENVWSFKKYSCILARMQCPLDSAAATVHELLY